jgi:hypothetical protein
MIQTKFGLNWPGGFRGEDFFPKLKNYEIKLKKERTSEQCPEFVNKKSKKAYTTICKK